MAPHKCGLTYHPGERLSLRTASDRNFDFLDRSALSPSGNFRIHYTLSGDHAVQFTNINEIPEYVIEAGLAADSAYNIIVNELGFLPPIRDNGLDGDEYDIYIKEYNGTYYGETPVSSGTNYATYLIIDNDFSEPNYYTKGLDALRVTIAHEFFHMVQLRYSNPFESYDTNPNWFEISSVWFEEKCYPEINDYQLYVQSNFNKSSFPNINGDYADSYGHGIFGEVLDKEYGVKQNKHIMLDIWEHLSTREATANLDQVLSSSLWHSSLKDALGKYSLYNVFTGSRAVDGLYYDDAADLPEIKTMEYILPPDSKIQYDFNLEPLQIDFKRFSTQTFSNFYVWGADLGSNQQVYLTYHSFDFGSTIKAPVVNGVWINCDSTNSQDYLIFPMVNGDRSSASLFSLNFEGTTVELNDRIQTLWPNPVVLDNDALHINLMLGNAGVLRLNVYDIAGQKVFQKRQFSPEGIRILDIQLPESTPSGLYILQIIANDTSMSRKFTIIK